MRTPQTPVTESATEEVLDDADLIVHESAGELVVDADDDDAFDSRETNALPRVDAARALAVLRGPRAPSAPSPELAAAATCAVEVAPLPDATEKVSAESILGVANALLAETEAPPPPRGSALASPPTPFSVALPIRIESRPLPTSGRVETLPEPAELDAWVPPTLPPRSQAIDPTAQLAAAPLGRYWPLFVAAAFVGLGLVGVASLGMRRHAILGSGMRAETAMLRGERDLPVSTEPAGPPRPAVAAKRAPLSATRPTTVAVMGRAPAAPAPKGPVKPPAKKPATKAATKTTPKAAPPPRHK